MSKDNFFQGFEPVGNLDGTPIEVKEKKVVLEPKSPILEPITPVSGPKPTTSGPKPSMPEPKPPIAVPKPPTPESKPPTPSTTPTPGSASHPSDGLTRKGEKELLRSEKKQTKAITIIAVAVAAVAAVALIVFFASGGVTRLQLCHTWYHLDRYGNPHSIIEFRFMGTGVSKDVGGTFDSMGIPFEYHLKADKTLTITATGGLFGLANGITEIDCWDSRAKDQKGGFWYIENGILYSDGDAYYKDYKEQKQKDLLNDKSLEEEVRNKADRYMQENYDEFELTSAKQDGVCLKYTYDVKEKYQENIDWLKRIQSVTLSYNTLDANDDFDVTFGKADRHEWHLEGEWGYQDDEYDCYLKVNRCEGDTFYFEYALHYTGGRGPYDRVTNGEVAVDAVHHTNPYSPIYFLYFQNDMSEDIKCSFRIDLQQDCEGIYMNGVRLTKMN